MRGLFDAPSCVRGRRRGQAAWSPRPRRSGANALHDGWRHGGRARQPARPRSEAAFARAFKRVIGLAPGSVKRVPALEIGALALPGPG